MITIRQRVAVCLALVILIVTGLAPPARGAAQPDETAAALAAARRQYEDAMQAVRRDTLAAVNQKIAAALQSEEGGDAALKGATAELEAFKATGAWPDVPNTPALKGAAAAAAKSMTDAYRRAVAAYRGRGNAAPSLPISAEWESFESQSDQVPWGENLLAAPAEAACPAEGKAEPIRIETGMKGAYRLEVVAKRKGDVGSLRVEFPLIDGRRLALPAVCEADGSTRILLSVWAEVVSADLGLARPIDLSAAVERSGSHITLAAVGEAGGQGGAFVVESVRVKPLILGEPQACSDPTAGGGTGPASRLSRGSRWSGAITSVAGDMAITAEVTRRDPRSAVLSVTGSDGKSDWYIDIELDQVTLKKARAGARGADDLKQIDVAGRIDGESLVLSGTWVRDQRGVANSENISIVLKLDPGADAPARP